MPEKQRRQAHTAIVAREAQHRPQTQRVTHPSLPQGWDGEAQIQAKLIARDQAGCDQENRHERSQQQTKIGILSRPKIEALSRSIRRHVAKAQRHLAASATAIRHRQRTRLQGADRAAPDFGERPDDKRAQAALEAKRPRRSAPQAGGSAGGLGTGAGSVATAGAGAGRQPAAAVVQRQAAKSQPATADRCPARRAAERHSWARLPASRFQQQPGPRLHHDASCGGSAPPDKARSMQGPPTQPSRLGAASYSRSSLMPLPVRASPDRRSPPLEVIR